MTDRIQHGAAPTGPEPSQVEAICHDEQMTIWAGETAGSLSMGGYLREDLSYDDKLDLHAVIARDLRDIINTALAESERKRVELEAEIAATRARLPESLRDSRLEFGVANLAMGYRSANDGRWRYGYAMRMLLQFVDRAAGEGLAFIETEDGPAIDAADLCADVADLLRIELDSDTFRALAKPPSEAELSALISQEAENGR